MPPIISICIPTYEYGGQGLNFLRSLLRSIAIQRFSECEIIISDHSVTTDIEQYCERKKNLNLKYFRNENNRGSIAANTNYAIQQASGSIIKLMYHDDFFIHKNALKLIVDFFERNDSNWIAHGFAHAKKTYLGWKIYNPMIPKWTSNLLIGDNRIGSPSCIAFRKEATQYMDENLKLLVDTELYYRMNLAHGLPGILPEILIANREHRRRTSTANVDYNFKIDVGDSAWNVDKNELDYVLEKHKETYRLQPN